MPYKRPRRGSIKKSRRTRLGDGMTGKRPPICTALFHGSTVPLGRNFVCDAFPHLKMRAIVNCLSEEKTRKRFGHGFSPWLTRSVVSLRDEIGMEAKSLQPMGRAFSPHDFTTALNLGRQPRLI